MNKTTWQEANQHYLLAALNTVQAALKSHASQGERDSTDVAQQALTAATEAMPDSPALDTLCALFELSTFERNLLLLCAGPELSSDFATVCAQAQGDSPQSQPTFSLALAALPHAYWEAIAPESPLRRWQLIELGPSSTLMTAPLRISERILHYLVGVPYLDTQLAGLLVSTPWPAHLAPSHEALAQRIVATWSGAENLAALPIIQLCGAEHVDKQAIATVASAMLKLDLHELSAYALPNTAADLATLARLWEREVCLLSGALLINGDGLATTDFARRNALTWFMEQTHSPLFISSRERLSPMALQRPLITFEVDKPPPAEQRLLWQNALGPSLNGHVDQLVTHFNLSTTTIRAASSEAQSYLTTSPNEAPLADVLWDICRVQARPGLDDLAQRIEPMATWEQLILPDLPRSILTNIAAHVQHRATVYKQWGFAQQSKRGLGISALFAGPSGTGKTMAAEVLARELRLDLYRIDLSAVVSKYIGETEKNMSRIFEAAESGGVILLFDEADALFGKRSQVKDSHDRHANIEISYLLQRMEAYSGLAILTTNMQDALDQAFMRRIRFIVQFPFPNLKQRLQIWQGVFPTDAPTEALQPHKLAKLNVAGGNIRNIALNAAFLAADAAEPVGMQHLLRAARSEYIKLQKTLTEAEVKDWI